MDFARSAKYILSALVLLSGLIMGSCRAEGMETADALGTEPAEGSYTLRFVAEGRELSSQTLNAGKLPEVPQAEAPEGTRFVGWTDETGRKASPASAPAEADKTYTAVFVPLLDGAGPYLFTGSGGLIRPDAVLDSTELTTALHALANANSRDYFPEELPAEDDVTVEELRAVLLKFFTSEELDRVILGHDAKEKISRSQFAEIMNNLLGREPQARVTVSGEVYKMPDLSPDREDYNAVMEASVPHGHSDSGSIWRRTELPSMYDEGFVLVEGRLYCTDAEGYFIRDTVLGTMTFSYDGHYTSGDPTLDSYVSAVISDLAENHSYTEPGELLHAAYDCCRDSFGIMRRNTYPIGARGWELGEAITMFEAGDGNSASFTAVFWALARGLGYEASAVSGVIGQNRLPHTWVEIEIDGKNYIFDPAAEAGALEDADTSRDRFMLSPDWAGILKYVKE